MFLPHAILTKDKKVISDFNCIPLRYDLLFFTISNKTEIKILIYYEIIVFLPQHNFQDTYICKNSSSLVVKLTEFYIAGLKLAQFFVESVDQVFLGYRRNMYIC